MPGPLFSVTFTGNAKIKKVLKQSQDAVRPAMAAGLYRLGCAVISNAIPRTPKDLGTLRNSAYCELPKGRGDNVSVSGGYGGFAKKYALPQHENMRYRHLEGGPKYLERAFREIKQTAATYLAGFMHKAIETGVQPTLQSMGVRTEPGPMASGKRRKRVAKKKKKARRRRKRKLTVAQKKLKKARAKFKKVKANVKFKNRNVRRVARGKKKLKRTRRRKKK